LLIPYIFIRPSYMIVEIIFLHFHITELFAE